MKNTFDKDCFLEEQAILMGECSMFPGGKVSWKVSVEAAGQKHSC